MKTNFDQQMERVKELAVVYNSGQAPIEVYQELHWLLWDWLAENPKKDKEDWPGWDNSVDADCGCFVCEYVNRRLDSNCKSCPCYNFCADPICWGTIHRQWTNAIFIEDFDLASTLAIQLRDCWPIEK